MRGLALVWVPARVRVKAAAGGDVHRPRIINRAGMLLTSPPAKTAASPVIVPTPNFLGKNSRSGLLGVSG